MVQSEDGTYSLGTFEVPEDTFREENGLIWEYVGQASFDSAPSPAEPGWRSVPDYVLTGLGYDAEAYMGVGEAQMVDAYGRLWLLAGLNYPALEAHLDATGGLMTEDDGIVFPDDAGDEYWASPMSYTYYYCAAPVLDPETCVNSQHGLNQVNMTSMDPRERNVVLIDTPAGVCSGVLVDDDSIITAAHCFGEAGSALPAPSSVTICTRGNFVNAAVCTTGFTILLKSGSTYDDVTANDVAIINVIQPFAETGISMSSVNNATLEAYEHEHHGYPGYPNASCVDNIFVASTGMGYSMAQYESGATLLSISGSVASFRASSGKGMSGGPYWYCPSGSCTGGAYITALQSQTVALSAIGDFTWMEGPLARDFRTWVLAHS